MEIKAGLSFDTRARAHTHTHTHTHYNTAAINTQRQYFRKSNQRAAFGDTDS